jgi:hypothetical protein
VRSGFCGVIVGPWSPWSPGSTPAPGIEQLRSAADGAGRLIEKQIEASVSLRDDLSFLTERGDRLADRLDALVRSARPLATEPTAMSGPAETTVTHLPTSRSPAEKGLLQALRLAR